MEGVLDSHVTLQLLRDLIPGAFVEGGSFANLLPRVHSIPATERPATLQSCRDNAANECTKELLRAAGLPHENPVPRNEGGPRSWPQGYVGSLTHKGTVVLGAMASSAAVRAIGVDLERVDREISSIGSLLAPEGLPPLCEAGLGALLSLTAKEAVYKAQFLVTGRVLNYSEVRLSWATNVGPVFEAMGDCGVALPAVVRCVVSHPWVISAAVFR